VDFTHEQEQQAVAEVTAQVLQAAQATELPADADYDEALWARMAAEGVLSLPLPAAVGGDDLGISEIGVLLTEVGKTAALVPALETFALGALPLVALGADPARWLAPVAEGAILTGAYAEPGAALPADPSTTARADGDGHLVSGHKISVRYAEQAAAVLVSTDAGIAVVDPRADGVELIRIHTATGTPEYTMVLTDVRIDADALLTGASLADVYRIVLAGTVSYAAGLALGVTTLTADHVGTREQFGKALASFQAVAQQIADVYVIARTLELAATAAVWNLAGERGADEDLATAAYWFADQLPVAMQICHHLHGGLGADITYPMHRYYELTKDLSRLVGGGAQRLDILGALGARELGVEVTCSSI